MENIKLQAGDYTTREEIVAYAEREGITLEQAYHRICDALVAGGAPIGEGVKYITEDGLVAYGWSAGNNGIFFSSWAKAANFTRHLTPEQILSANKQEGLQSEKQAPNPEAKKIAEMIVGEVFGKYAAKVIAKQARDKDAWKESTEHLSQRMDELRDVWTNGKPKQIGELTVGLNVDLVSDLQTIISDYMYLLDSIKDPFARGVIKAQLTDLTDLQYKQLKGDTNA